MVGGKPAFSHQIMNDEVHLRINGSDRHFLQVQIQKHHF